LFSVPPEPPVPPPAPVIPAEAPPGWFEETREAVERVEANAQELWKATCYAVAVSIAESNELFTSADVDAKMKAEHPDVVTHEGRAMGPVILRLFREGIAKKTGDVIHDPRPQFHNQYKNLLRSLVFRG